MGTWRVADIDRVVPVIQALNGLEWPQTRTAVRELLGSFGWTPTRSGLGMFSDLGVTPGPVSLTAVEDQLTDVEFTVCDVFPDDEVEAKADFLQDAFADYAVSFRRLWGAPVMSRSTPIPEIWWSVGNDCVLKLERVENLLTVEFTTPLGVKLDRLPDVRL